MAMTTWNFDPAHSEIAFKVRHMMFSKVSGQFHDWEGEFEFDPDNPASAQTSAKIDVSSIDTGNDDRDEHLRSDDFFAPDKYPHLKFESTKATHDGNGQLALHGNLTIRGETQPVELDVEYHGKAVDPWGNDRVGFTATGELNRKDFGLTWNQALEAGGVLVGDKVELELNIQAIKAE